MKQFLWAVILSAVTLLGFALPQYPLRVVSAENFYGDVAKTIGGSYINVTSIINDPKIDAQFFNPPADVINIVKNASLIIANGNGYDAWMDMLYEKNQQQIPFLKVATVTRIGNNFEPHIWFNPQTMPLFATALVNRLSQLDPRNTSSYQSNLQGFLQMAQLYQIQLNKVTNQVAGMRVMSAEPVCNALLLALQLKVTNHSIQVALENNLPLTLTQVEALKDLLKDHAVDLFIYNASDPDSKLVVELINLAKANQITVLGVYETMPPNLHYYQWMYQTLFSIRDALLSSKNAP